MEKGNDGTIVLDVVNGGELGKMIGSLFGKKIICSQKGKDHDLELLHFLGYPHDGGLADKNMERFWLYVECKYCGYQWSWHKLERRIKEFPLIEQKMQEEK